MQDKDEGTTRPTVVPGKCLIVIAAFTLESIGGSTNVTWAMYGPSPYLAKVMTIFFNMDRMVGRQFEEGLANLKRLTET